MNFDPLGHYLVYNCIFLIFLFTSAFILGALKKNAATQEVNQKEAEQSLSKWFTGARDRGGNRAARARRTQGDTGEVADGAAPLS